MDSEDSYIGKQLGNYRLVAELNSGSYGSVYQGKHIIFADDPMVAIKMLHAHLGSPKERAQFIQEAQLLKKLKHPHILPIIDAGIQDGLPYIVTEYASHGSLLDRLKQQPNQPLSLEEALSILTQIGQALHYAHQQRIVHRDLKPGNILFNAQGETLLADFGIAAVLATAGTKQLGRGGTPAYMAPEQFEGIVSMKSDQYALGCLAYELVTGRNPFDVENVFIEAIWYQHAKVDPVAPTQLNPHLPIHIEQAILKAIAKQRADRYADVSDFIAALRPPLVRTSTSSSAQKTKEQWLDEALTHHEAKRYMEALNAYEQAILLDPGFTSAYNGKSLALYNLKRYREALDILERAIVLAPNDVSLYYGKGLVLEQMEDYQDALRTYEQAIRLDPSYALAWRKNGDVLRRLNRPEEALAAYEHATKLETGEM